MSGVPSVEGHGRARLVPERRARLRALIAAAGVHGAARSLRIGVVTLERAADAYALLPLSTVRRLDLAIDRLGTSP